MTENGNASNLSGAEFAEFWEEFKILPWQWTDTLFKRSRYLVSTIIVAYALLAVATLTDWLGYSLTLLDEYPSITILFAGWALLLPLGIRWRHKIPQFFQWLWQSNRLDFQGGTGDIEGSVLASKEKFKAYLDDYQDALCLNFGAPLLGMLLFLLMLGLLIWGGLEYAVKPLFSPYPKLPFIALDLVLLIVCFWAFVIGQFCWALFTTGRFISKLPKLFEIRIQLSHPDQCGGLKPIGDFCLDAAIPLIGGGFMLVMTSLSGLDSDPTVSVMSNVFTFVLVGPLTALTFFIPLSNIHDYMIDSKKDDLDTFANQLEALEKTIRLHTQESGDLASAAEAKAKWETLMVIYPDAQRYPVWPFRLAPTVLAIFSPQILQIIVGIIIDIYTTFFK